MFDKLKGINVAILVADGFEQIELVEPKKALEENGAQVKIISPEKVKVNGWNHANEGDFFDVDVQLDQANASDYDALVLPGGVMNPDYLRTLPSAIEFIKYFVNNHKPIAAICHAPWTLINAEAVKGRKLTSWQSVKIDLINAGAQWIDAPTVRDDMLLTSRKPADIPMFNQAMIELFGEVNSK